MFVSQDLLLVWSRKIIDVVKYRIYFKFYVMNLSVCERCETGDLSRAYHSHPVIACPACTVQYE